MNGRLSLVSVNVGSTDSGIVRPAMESQGRAVTRVVQDAPFRNAISHAEFYGESESLWAKTLL